MASSGNYFEPPPLPRPSSGTAAHSHRFVGKQGVASAGTGGERVRKYSIHAMAGADPSVAIRYHYDFSAGLETRPSPEKDESEIWLNGSLINLANRTPLDRDPKRLTCFPPPGEAKQRPFMVFKPNKESDDEQKTDEPEVSSDNHEAEGDQGPIYNPQMKDYWMPDKMCKQCHNCDQAFTMFKRRHHCRFCGHVFCHNCSAYFIESSNFGFQRACNLCRVVCANSPGLQNRKETSSRTSGSVQSIQRKTFHKPPPRSPVPGRPSRNKSAANLMEMKKGERNKEGGKLIMRRASSAGHVTNDGGQLFDGNSSLSRKDSSSSMSSVTVDDSEQGRASEISGVSRAEIEELSHPPEFEQACKIMAVPIKELNELSMVSSEQQEQMTEHRRILESVAMNHLEAMVQNLLSLSTLLDRSIDWAPTIVSLCQQVCANVDPDVKGGDDFDIRPYVKIKTVPGGDISECCYIDGVIFRKTPVHKAMSERRLQQPRVLLLSCSIEFERHGNTRISYFEALVEQERTYMEILVRKILTLKPHLLLVGKSVSRYAQEFLAKENVVVVQHVKSHLMKRIARLVGARILPSADHVDHHGEKALGFANEFYIRSFYSPDLEQRIGFMREELNSTPQGRERVLKMSEAEMIKRVYGRVRGNGKVNYAYLVGCPRNLGCTALLRGASKTQLKEVKRIMRFALSVAYNLRLEVSFLHDRGATFPLAHVAQMALTETSKATNLSPRKLLSTSMEVDVGPPSDRPGCPWGSQHQSKETTVYDHQGLLTTTFTMCHRVQCQPAQTNGCMFYKLEDKKGAADKVLGQFLLENCFNLHKKCPHVYCKRSVTEHVLSFFHKSGRISISVHNVDDYTKSPDQWDRDEDNRPRHDQSRPIRMWNYCVKCERVVGTPVVMSGDTWKFSFGKFLEVYFYNETSIGRSAGCLHSTQTDLKLFFGCDNLVAQFKYEHIEPYTVFVRDHLRFDKDWHMAQVQSVIIDTMHITCPLFEAFLERIKEFSQAVLFESQLKNYEKKSLNRELVDMQREVATASILFFNQMPSLIKDPDYWEEMRMMKARMFSILDTLEWVTKQENWEYNQSWALRELAFSPTLKSSDHVLLKFPMVLRQRMFRVMQNWNDRLAMAGRLLQVLEKNKGQSNRNNKDDFEGLVLLKTGGKLKSQNRNKETGQDNVSDYEKESEDDFYLRYEKEKRLGDDRALRDKMRARDQFVLEITKNIIDIAVSESEGEIEVPVRYVMDTILWAVEDRALEKHREEKKQKQLTSSQVKFLGNGESPMDLRVHIHHKALSTNLKVVSQDEYDMPANAGFGPREVYVRPDSLDFQTDNCKTRMKSSPSQTTSKVDDMRPIEEISKDFQEKYQVFPKVRKIGRSPKLKEHRTLHQRSFSRSEYSDLEFVDEIIMPDESQSSTPIEREEPIEGDISVELAPSNMTKKEEQNQKERKSAAAKFQNALARFMGKDIVEEIDWAVPLGQLGEGKPSMEPGVDGKTILVYEDQPMSIIAYSLMSKKYAKAMTEYQRRSMLPDQSMYWYDEERRKAVDDVIKTVEKENRATEKLFNDHRSQETPSEEFDPEQYSRKELEKLILSQQKTDFKHRFSVDDEKGNAIVKFVCHSYWALQFRALRAAYCDELGFSDEGFIHSLSAAHTWDARGGKSGAQFFMTQDSRFVVKFVSRTELQMFLEVAPAYFEYMAKALFGGIPSVLVKIMGVYQIGYHNRTNGKRYMEQAVVMQNLFHERKITKVFDLKGSTRSRYVNVNNPDSNSGKLLTENKVHQVLLDENLMEWTEGRPLPVCAWSQSNFHMAILNDSLFLSLINVVDYSILVGIDEEKHELVVGIIDYMRQYDIIKKMERVGKSVGMIAGQAEPTIIQPASYKARFQLAMKRYFMSVPDKWSTKPPKK